MSSFTENRGKYTNFETTERQPKNKKVDQSFGGVGSLFAERAESPEPGAPPVAFLEASISVLTFRECPYVIYKCKMT